MARTATARKEVLTFQPKSNLDLIELMLSELRQHQGTIDKMIEKASMQEQSIKELKRNEELIKRDVSKIKADIKQVNQNLSKTIDQRIEKHPILAKKERASKMACEEMLEFWSSVFSFHDDIRDIAKRVVKWNLSTIKDIEESYRGKNTMYDKLLCSFCKEFIKHYYSDANKAST